MAEVFNDVACTTCGSVCDDLTLHVEAGRVTNVERACQLSEPYFLAQTDGSESPVALVQGEPAELPVAIEKAAELLRTSRAPLIYGLSTSSTPGVRAACQLADQLGAAIDPASSACHRGSVMAMQSAGASTATLGEVRHRSDLIVYWGSNPVESQPRHFERIVDVPGMFVPAGRKSRRIVIVDHKHTATADEADQFVKVQPGGDFDLLWALRAAIQRVVIHENSVAGVSTTDILAMADEWKNSNYAAFFYCSGLTEQGVPHANVEALLRMVTDLNAHTRAVALSMPNAGSSSAAGSSAAGQVLCWQTGYPFGVSLARGFPRYNPPEYTANDLLAAQEVDAVVLVGSESVGQLSPTAQASLQQLPTIVLDTHGSKKVARADVEFTVATYGIHRPGTAYRMDNVPIPLRTVLTSQLPSDDEILHGICAALDAQR